MTQVAMIIPAIALALLPVAAGVLFFRTKTVISRLGAYEYALPLSRSALTLMVLFVIPVLIALTVYRRYEVFASFAVSAVGVFGFTMALRDVLYNRCVGVYQNGLIWNGNPVFYASITEYERVEPLLISIKTRHHSERILSLPDVELLERVKATLDSRVQPLQ